MHTKNLSNIWPIKIVALTIFIILPFLGFFLGTIYQKHIIGSSNVNTDVFTQTPIVTATISAVVTTTPVSTVTIATTITNKDTGKTITVKKNTFFQLQLANTYWNIQDPDKNLLTMTDSSTSTQGCSKGPPGMGCGGKTATYFANKIGTTKLTATRSTCGEALACNPEEELFEVSLNIIN